MFDPKPISLQCPLKFLAIPIESSCNGTIGIFRFNSTLSFDTFDICPTVIDVFALSINNSPCASGLIVWECLSPIVFLNNSYFIFAVFVISGRFPSVDATPPDI